MSFTSSGRRHSGGKGFSGGKKPKRRRQEFHERRLKDSGRPVPDLEQLRERVVIALNRLGHQKLSADPGGYDLKNWMKNFNLLLDDFEEKVGAANLPAEYLKKRGELTASLLKQVDTSSVAAEIEGLRREDAELSQQMDEEKARLNAELEALKDEQTRISSEIVDYRRRLEAEAEGQKAMASRPLLQRLFGRAPQVPTERAEDKLKELESRLESLRRETAGLQRVRGFLGERAVSPESPYAEESEKAESLRADLERLEAMKMDMVHLSPEREQVTGTLAALISGINLAGTKSEAENDTIEYDKGTDAT